MFWWYYPKTLYTVLYSVISDDISSIYAAVVTDKSLNSFRVQFSGTIDSAGTYYIHWLIPNYTPFLFDLLEYYQTSGFRDFDSEGRFDCTHGFDHVEITVERVCNSLLQEDGFNLLQENGDKICLESLVVPDTTPERLLKEDGFLLLQENGNGIILD